LEGTGAGDFRRRHGVGMPMVALPQERQEPCTKTPGQSRVRGS